MTDIRVPIQTYGEDGTRCNQGQSRTKKCKYLEWLILNNARCELWRCNIQVTEIRKNQLLAQRPAVCLAHQLPDEGEA